MRFDKDDFTTKVREVESLHSQIHQDLIQWGQWAKNGRRDPLCNALRPAGIWSLPGEYDPGTDPEAVPESPPTPINVRRVREIDTRIATFTHLPRCVLRASYVTNLLEYQRPQEARCGYVLFLETLKDAMRLLQTRSARLTIPAT